MHAVQGGCHCGNITYVAEFTNGLSKYTPRACDCRFCMSHGASYASDSRGTLTISIKNESDVSKYRQGSRVADFIICRKCGIMTGVCYEENGRIYGTINVKSTDACDAFNRSHVAYLEQLNEEERIMRWKNYWFANVKFKYESA